MRLLFETSGVDPRWLNLSDVKSYNIKLHQSNSYSTQTGGRQSTGVTAVAGATVATVAS